MVDFKNKQENLARIIEKNNLGFFWEAFNFFVDNAGYAEESAFAECIFFFGEENMFKEIISVNALSEGNITVKFQLKMYYNINYHESQENLIKFCIKNNFDVQKFGVEVKEIVVNIKSIAVMGYIKIMYEVIFKRKFPEIIEIISAPTPTNTFHNDVNWRAGLLGRVGKSGKSIYD